MTLTTQRLVIRPFLETDGEDLYEYLSDDKTLEFEPCKPFTHDAAIDEAKRRSVDEHFLAVCLEDGKLIGNLYFAEGEFGTYEVGYVFNRRYWKHGYASEALSVLLRYAFTELKIHRIIAMCDPNNPNSWRLLERMNMRREAHKLKNVYFFTDESGNPIWKDTYEYGIIREEYIAKT